MTPTLLLTGATGTVGGHLADQLRKKQVSARLLVRDPAAASHLAAPTAELVTADLKDALTTSAALQGIETAFLLTPAGPDSVRLQRQFIDVAADSGVKHVVKVSALGASPDSPVQLGRWHAEIEAHLKASGLTWTILQPHSFMQNLLASAATIRAAGAWYGCSGDGAYSAIDARDVAAAAAAILPSPELHEGQTYLLTGPEPVTQADQAKALTRALDRTIRYIDLPPDQFREGMIAAGLPEWLADDLVGLQQFFSTGHAADVSPVVEVLTGSPPATFDRFAADHADAFRP